MKNKKQCPECKRILPKGFFSASNELGWCKSCENQRQLNEANIILKRLIDWNNKSVTKNK